MMLPPLLRTRVPAICLAVMLSALAPAALAQQPAAAVTSPATRPVSVAAPASEMASTSALAQSLPGPITSQEEIENPYGLSTLWAQGDVVARGTLILMLLMSMGSWYILFTKFADQRQLFKQAADASERFWRAASVAEGAQALSEDSALRKMAEQGLDAARHHEGTLVERIDLHTWISMSVQRSVDAVHSRLQGGLAFLATVGSTAPFIGLFGTVWGIYHALTAIGISGQASIDKVAGPVGEALIMTAFGLGVAVPAVMGYNLLIRRNKLVMEQVRSFAADLHNVLIAGNR